MNTLIVVLELVGLGAGIAACFYFLVVAFGLAQMTLEAIDRKIASRNGK
jgi:hypothetical protein